MKGLNTIICSLLGILLISCDSEFVKIQPGEFMMGSNFAESTDFHPEWYMEELPVHKESLERELYIAKTEVTMAQFREFVNATKYITSAEKKGFSFGKYHENEVGKASWTNGDNLNWKNPGYTHLESFPVTHVSWEDAMAYCKWLTEKDSDNDWIYTLPNESQWEYVASCGGTNKYGWGNNDDPAAQGANIADLSFITEYPNWNYPVLKEYDDGHALVAPVQSYKPNNWSVFDMTGNVWEWTIDQYSAYMNADEKALEAVKSNQIQITQNETLGSYSDLRVHKGGGFDWELPFLRVAKRRAYLKDFSAIHIGFRIIKYKK